MHVGPVRDRHVALADTEPTAALASCLFTSGSGPVAAARFPSATGGPVPGGFAGGPLLGCL
jgi:hypothetical protein